MASPAQGRVGFAPDKVLQQAGGEPRNVARPVEAGPSLVRHQNLNVTPTVNRRNFSSLTSRASAAAAASSFRIARK
jgi:hypothetical protein